MRRPGSSALVTAAMAFTFANGCSIALVTSRRASQPSEGVGGCTTQYTGPILDSLLFIPPAVVAGGAIGQSSDGGAAIPRSAQIGIGLLGAFIFAASAVYGYHAVGDCRDAYARTGKPLPD